MFLTTEHLFILHVLADDGPSALSRFEEKSCDELFRAKPRLIQLRQGYVEPIIEISTEGLKSLAARSGVKRVKDLNAGERSFVTLGEAAKVK
jgi:hypothetical protein